VKASSPAAGGWREDRCLRREEKVEEEEEVEVRVVAFPSVAAAERVGR